MVGRFGNTGMGRMFTFSTTDSYGKLKTSTKDALTNLGKLILLTILAHETNDTFCISAKTVNGKTLSKEVDASKKRVCAELVSLHNIGLLDRLGTERYTNYELTDKGREKAQTLKNNVHSHPQVTP